MVVEVAVALLGGLLSLLSPCSALLLPAFFAYAFPSRSSLVLRTGIFYLGLVTLLVPLGVGVGAVSGAVLQFRGPLTLVAGVTLIGIGAIQLAFGGFELPGAGGRWHGVSSESAASTYVLGLTYGLSGFCAGPILGGILTVAATAGGALPGALLLAAYAAGMALPLLLLALAWERMGAGGRGRLRATELHLGPVRRHASTVASSVMFIVLGVGFIVFEGSSALAGIYAGLGADALALELETALQNLGRSAPLAVVAVPLVLVVALVVWAQARHGGRRA